MGKWQYTKGLHDLGHGCFAYLQPDGSWGWSNAGLVTDGGQTLLVDTLFDLPLTADMLKTIRNAVPAARKIGKLVNTHANGDHVFGNQLVEGAEIIACRACAEEFAEAPPSMLIALETGWKNLGEGGAFFHEVMGRRFDWNGIVSTPPTTLFDQTMEVKIGNKRLVLTHLGSAHTRGDVLVHVPADRVLYTGDLLFVGGHPVIWAGPVENWIKACDYILGLDVEVIVPGHRPIADKAAVRDLRSYFEYITSQARMHFDNGVPYEEAARKISLDRFAGWLDPERIIINVASLYRQFSGPTAAAVDRVALFAQAKYTKSP
jgi:cyclase